MIKIIPYGKTFIEGFSVSQDFKSEGYSIEELSNLSSDKIKYYFGVGEFNKKCITCGDITQTQKIIMSMEEPIDTTYTAYLCEECLLKVNICALCLRVRSKENLHIWEGRFGCDSCLDKLGELDYDN